MPGSGRRHRVRSASGVVQLRLYLADDAPASLEALNNVRAALQELPPERYALHIINAYNSPELALADGVVMTPALVRVDEPKGAIVGVLAEPRQIVDLLEGVTREGEGGLAPREHEVAPQALELARKVIAARDELQALVGMGVDMVLAPESAEPVVLPAPQRAARDEAENFRRIFDEAPLGMALLSHDFRFRRANQRLSTVTGYSPCELLKMNLSDLTGEKGETAEELKLTGSRRCETGFCEGEILFKKKSGEEVWLRLSLALVKHPQEGHSHFLLIAQDITKMKGAEAELLRYHGQLEELVRERTAELAAANRKLMKEIEERHEAEDAVRALNEELETRVRERTAELEESNRQLETMNKFFVGRELRMAELKHEIKTLEEEVQRLKEGRNNRR